MKKDFAVLGVLLLGIFSFVGASGTKSPTGVATSKEVPMVSLDTRGTQVPLPSLLRAMVESAGYTALVADVPENKRVAVRKLNLPLEEALRFVVGGYLGKDYAYTILPERKLVVIARKENLEALAQRAPKVEVPPKVGTSQAKPEEKTPSTKERTAESSPQEASGERVFHVFSIPQGVDPESLRVLEVALPGISYSFIRTAQGDTGFIYGKASSLEKAKELLEKLLAPLSTSKSPGPMEEAKDYFIPLSFPITQETLNDVLRELDLRVRALPLPNGVYCRGLERECLRLESILKKLAPPSPSPKESPLLQGEQFLVRGYPIYGNVDEVYGSVEKLLSPLLKERGGEVYLQKEAKRVVLRGPVEAHRVLYAFLEEADPPMAPSKGEEPQGEAFYKPLYVKAEELVSEVGPLYPSLKMEVSGKVLRVFGPLSLVERVAKLLAEKDRPSPQVVYRVIVFSTTEDKLGEVGSSLEAVLRSGLKFNLGGNLSLGGVYPPDPNASVGLLGALKLAEQKGYGKNILNTTLVAVSGVESFIQSGGSVTVLTPTSAPSGQLQPGPGPAPAPNQPQGGSQPLQYEYGLILRIKPQVLSENLIQTTVSLELSDEPIVSQNSVRFFRKRNLGEYLIQPGGILAIGGIISSRESVTKQGIPLLMDIPLLGSLFSTEKRTTLGEYLLIYLIPETVTFPPSKAEPPVLREVVEEGPKLLPKRTPPEVPSMENSSPSRPLSSSDTRGSQSSPLPSPKGPQVILAEILPGFGGVVLRFPSDTPEISAIQVEGRWYKVSWLTKRLASLGASLAYGTPYLARGPQGEMNVVFREP